METMIVRATLDETGCIFVQAMGGGWEGLMSHGDTLQEAFANFGEAATVYLEEIARRPQRPHPANQ